jgi:hypothetical protein
VSILGSYHRVLCRIPLRSIIIYWILRCEYTRAMSRVLYRILVLHNASILTLEALTCCALSSYTGFSSVSILGSCHRVLCKIIMLHNENILTLYRWGAVAVSSYRTIVTQVSLRCTAGPDWVPLWSHYTDCRSLGAA